MKETAQESVEKTGKVTVGDLVAKDFRAAGIFEKYGIDFCCGGNVAVDDICNEMGIDPVQVRREIEQAAATPMDRSQNYNAWELPFLADYIVNTHHTYLKENTRTIAAYANKIAQVHGANHPEVVKIAEIFEKVAADMELHLREEEEQLFPAIKRMVELAKAGTTPKETDVQSLRMTLSGLNHEHDEIGAAVHAIRDLSNNYAVPGDVCNTFMVTYMKLKEFEDDLHKHVHLENNILFPKAAKL
ncbi:iron-sulfur cluster repair di-iron protein [Geomonas sp.]|uniref:iron-sulfur cluster repair di-iron protein n=1 Tax=Geomonas sp. TaxID=2651584 RepID=UPI002B49F098|nr:iron-sulfur cluster repair di-iron protein [Geomonas sp.]HJV35149.1 iron-sulfur cluster repair di-iron protein [Geomonas sp.]